MQTSDKIAFAALLTSILAIVVSIATPLIQLAYGRIQRQRNRLELRVGTVGLGQVAVEAFFQADHGHQGLIATLHKVRPDGARIVMFLPGTENRFTGEIREHGFEEEDSDLPRTVTMIPVEGGEPFRFMFAFIYYGHGTANPVTIDLSINSRVGNKLGRYRRTVYPVDYGVE
ncbi:hypothetical protein ACIQTU_13900 [Brevundimonas sp. NPDC090276]|uniref:hypothetical protein n=1 Tax=Brevundimonas sp. NPDC090276 TaxID=3363956 RepID=UPI00383A4C62